MNTLLDKTTEEWIEGLNDKKQTLIRFMQRCHFDVERFRLGKSAVWRFSMDQGVYQGSNVYEVRQDKLTALWVANVLEAEKMNTRDEIEALLYARFAQQQSQESS